LAQATRRFDEQAGSFEQRAGLPSSVADSVAQALVRLTRLGRGEVPLEAGAGPDKSALPFASFRCVT